MATQLVWAGLVVFAECGSCSSSGWCAAAGPRSTRWAWETGMATAALGLPTVLFEMRRLWPSERQVGGLDGRPIFAAQFIDGGLFHFCEGRFRWWPGPVVANTASTLG